MKNIAFLQKELTNLLNYASLNMELKTIASKGCEIPSNI